MELMDYTTHGLYEPEDHCHICGWGGSGYNPLYPDGYEYTCNDCLRKKEEHETK